MAKLFHVAPHECRTSIEKHGLSNGFCEVEVWSDHDSWDEGTYLWETIELAEEYRRDSFPVPADIYEVEMSGLPVRPDFTSTDRSRVEGAWYCPEVINSSLLVMAEPLEACLYHGTSRSAWESIRESGLGASESRNGVFVTHEYQAALDYALSASGWDPARAAVIRVTGPEMTFQPNGRPAPPYFQDDWHEDSMPGLAWELDTIIPPSKLRLLEVPVSHFHTATIA